jgi:serine/threonine protein phosphatase PrpC
MPAPNFRVSVHGSAPSGTKPFAFICERNRAVVVLCDGAGSWGRGIEAANASATPMLDSLIRHVSDEAPFQSSFDVATDCASRFVDDFGAGFSAVLAVVTTDTAKLAWAGHASALVTRKSTVIERAHVRTIATELARVGTITPEEIATHRLHRVTTTAIFGDQSPDFDTTTWRVQPGDRVYFGSHFNDLVPEDTVDDVALAAKYKHNVLLSLDIIAGG